MGVVRRSNSSLVVLLMLAGTFGCSEDSQAPETMIGPVTGGMTAASITGAGTGTTGTPTGGTTDAAGVTTSTAVTSAGTTGLATNTASSVGGVGGASGATSGMNSVTSNGTSGNTATTGGIQTGSCTFTVNSEISSAIATVGIVTWSTDATVQSAEIHFGLADSGMTMTAPVDLAEADYRTLLLGMKGERDYAFQIVADTSAGMCTSETYTITTGPVSNSVPVIDHQVMNAAAVAPGFIVTSAGIGNGGGIGGGIGGGGSGTPAFILDSDGDVVWWAPAPAQTSRARMDWEGKNMWMLSLNVGNGGGDMRRVSMDGLDVEDNVQGLSSTHHDFTVLPGGIVASVSWIQSGMDPPSDLIERSPDGTIKTVVRLDSNIYQSSTFHANSIHYHPSDDSYTISDRNPNLYVKVNRQGQVLWQFGGNCSNAPAPKCVPGDWSVNHGHHLLDNGNMLIFNNGAGFGGGGSSPALEFSIDFDAGTSNQVWQYTSSNSSPTLGDVQRLPNGNTMVVYSNSGVIQEVDSSGNVVQSFSTGSLGYIEHRPTLYGPPPK